jgi:hypothetical protein
MPADIDLVVANPLVSDFREALATRLGVSPDKLGGPTDGPPVHTAGLAVALESADDWQDSRTLLLVSGGAGLMAGAALLRG